MASEIHVCTSPLVGFQRRIFHCPTCDRRRRFVVQIYEWYDPTCTCCGCGDAWSGERLPRPFKPDWRRESIARAKRKWANPPPVTPLVMHQGDLHSV